MTDPIDLPLPRPGGVPPRPRGGQRGNRNALKHGFYARTFPSSEAKEIETYTFQGLQEEIAALRLLNRRAIQRAFLHAEEDAAFQDDARVVIGLTVALNTTLRTQLELDLRGGSELDALLKEALQEAAEEMGLDPVGN